MWQHLETHPRVSSYSTKSSCQSKVMKNISREISKSDFWGQFWPCCCKSPLKLPSSMHIHIDESLRCCCCRCPAFSGTRMEIYLGICMQQVSNTSEFNTHISRVFELSVWITKKSRFDSPQLILEKSAMNFKTHWLGTHIFVQKLYTGKDIWGKIIVYI